MSAVPLTAAEAGLVSCESCGLLSRPAHAAEPGYCPRCSAELVWRRHNSIQYTWALVIAAAICYIPANVLPVLNTTTLGSTDSDTIMGGVVFLYTSGSWPLALNKQARNRVRFRRLRFGSPATSRRRGRRR